MTETDIVYFWRQSEVPYGVFSNWAITPFKENNIEFQSTEHYLMFHKAVLMADAVMANAIVKAATPKRAKELGRQVRNWDEEKWEKHREQIMYDGILLKCRAHPDIAKLLLETGSKVIAEASPYDKIWGIGLRAEMAMMKKKFNGLNLLGKALMNVRSTLRSSDKIALELAKQW